jgi:raffinose/stachyose/melibiose transport system permease protein
MTGVARDPVGEPLDRYPRRGSVWGRGVSADRSSDSSQPRRARLRLTDRQAGYLLIAPSVLLLGAFLVYPLVKAAIYSFENWDGIGTPTPAGLSNYAGLWTQPIERGALANVGILIVFYAVLPTFLGLVAASLLGRIPRRGAAFYRAVLFLPQVLVTVVVAIVWTWILAPSGTGTLNSFLHALHLGPASGTPWLGDFSTALVSVGLIAVWLDFGLCFVLFLSGVQRISPSLYDAARVDGAGLIREFLTITVPMLRREIGIALTITTVQALQNFTLIYAATDGGPGNSTNVPGLLVYRDAFQFGQIGTASALGIALSILVFICTFVIRAVLEPRDGNKRRSHAIKRRRDVLAS